MWQDIFGLSTSKDFFLSFLVMQVAMEVRNRMEEEKEVINGLSVTFRTPKCSVAPCYWHAYLY